MIFQCETVALHREHTLLGNIQLSLKNTFNVIVPMNPALTMTGSFSEFNASAFNFKSLRTTSPTRKVKQIKKQTHVLYKCIYPMLALSTKLKFLLER